MKAWVGKNEYLVLKRPKIAAVLTFFRWFTHAAVGAHPRRWQAYQGGLLKRGDVSKKGLRFLPAWSVHVCHMLQHGDCFVGSRETPTAVLEFGLLVDWGPRFK